LTDEGQKVNSDDECLTVEPHRELMLMADDSELKGSYIIRASIFTS